MSELRYTIGELAQKAGISQHTIRAWEKRYDAIHPERTDSNQRVYNQDQLERLALLRRVTELKHPIGRVAKLSSEELHSIVDREASQSLTSDHPQPTEEILKSCLRAIENLREDELLQTLRRSAAVVGISHLLNHVILPLLREIGERWQSGALRIHQEHMATSIIRMFLTEYLATINPKIDHPRIVVTTPQNQIHEIGAILAAIGCAVAGWNVLYLGANLPSSDIADAISRSHADALALSIVYPLDDLQLPESLVQLRQAVGPRLPIYVGGSGKGSYSESLEHISARQFEDWSDLIETLS